MHENAGVDQNDVLSTRDVGFNTKPSLIRIVDMLGNETQVKLNTVLLYVIAMEALKRNTFQIN